MNDETLERLMIDDALGALPPDTSALLEAYTVNAASDDQRLKWRRLAELAAETTKADQGGTVPPFPGTPLRLLRFQRVAVSTLAAAAVLALGLGIGLYIPTLHPRTSSPAALITRDQSEDRLVEPVTKMRGVAGMWSSDRLLAVATERRVGVTPQWRWSSPVVEPELRGMP